jgi:hypothetical protein
MVAAEQDTEIEDELARCAYQSPSSQVTGTCLISSVALQPKSDYEISSHVSLPNQRKTLFWRGMFAISTAGSRC